MASAYSLLRQHCGVGTVSRGHVGGEGALARRTMLGDPSVPIRAKVWRYDPDTTARQDEIVDPISLHLQFRDHPDERLAITAHELLQAELPVT